MTDPIPLHCEYHPPTRIARRLFERAWAISCKGEALPVADLAAELVALGVPTTARALQIIDAHFHASGAPPLEKDGNTVAYLIGRYAGSLELLALICGTTRPPRSTTSARN